MTTQFSQGHKHSYHSHYASKSNSITSQPLLVTGFKTQFSKPDKTTKNEKKELQHPLLYLIHMAKEIKWSTRSRVRIQINTIESIGTKLGAVNVLVWHRASACIQTTG